MNKTHWNTVRVNEDVPDELIYSLVDESYGQVVKSFTKKRRNELSLG
jgi:predicted DNA-binding protein (MmcQ/YjbR family)